MNGISKIDLHLHSCYSDGKLSPAEVIRKCPKSGLRLVALTDHDTVEGIPEAIRAAEECKIKIVKPASAECATSYWGITNHILAYGFDLDKNVRAFLRTQDKNKFQYAKEIIKDLTSLGVEISLDQIKRFSKGTIEDVHIWMAVSENQENLFLLSSWGVNNYRDFNLYILKEDKGGEKKKISTERLINIIKDAGGYTVFAHPFWKRDPIEIVEARIKVFQEMGLDGVEVFYPKHGPETVLRLHKIVEKFGMAETAGSDFHGYNKKMRIKEIPFYGIKNPKWLLE